MRNYIKLSTEEKFRRAVLRFWKKVDKGPLCWNWIASKTEGYGAFSLKGFPRGAHRFSFFLTNGDFDRSLCVLHTCDNPACVNPSHLFLGTKGDNFRDCISKGRNNPTRGERSASAKLTAKIVASMREDYRSFKRTAAEIGAMVGVSQQEASRAIRGKTWAHVPGKVLFSERARND
jgi:hypothetical protein